MRENFFSALVTICLAFIVTSPSARAEPKPTASTASATSPDPAWKDRADAMMSAVPSAGPGLVVEVTSGGKAVYRHARGLASVELGVPLTIDSAFRIGSLTKPVTAATVLRLMEEKRLSLDSPVATWLPSVYLAKAMTPRQLLAHTAGDSDAWDAELTDRLDGAGRVKRMSTVPNDFTPGMAWHYSNSGYMLLGMIIEKVTGTTWFEAAATYVLKPLKMDHTGFFDDDAVVPGMAAGYSRNATGQVTRPALYTIAGPSSAGALTSTVPDYSRLLRGLATGELLTAATYRAMATSPLIDGKPVPNGLGIGLTSIQGAQAIDHTGGVEGYSAYAIYLPAPDISVVVMANSDAPVVQPRSIGRRLAALALGKPYAEWPSMTWTPAATDAAKGDYAIPGGGVHHLTVRDGTLWISRDDGPPHLLVTSRDSTLVYAGDGIDYIVVRGETGGPSPAIEFHVDGGSDPRIEPRAIGHKRP